jgi:hypothetical protein
MAELVPPEVETVTVLVDDDSAGRNGSEELAQALTTRNIEARLANVVVGWRMDHDEIVDKRVRNIARVHGCTIADVNAALDAHPIELDRDRFLKRGVPMSAVSLCCRHTLSAAK